MNIVKQSAFQYICTRCLRIRYCGGPEGHMEDGTLAKHEWKSFFRPSGKKTKCDFCGVKLRYLFARPYPHQ